VQPKDARVKTAIPSGYTDGCYYQPEKKGLDNKNRVSNDPNKRYECCCINAVDIKNENYYQWDDINLYIVPDGEKNRNCAFESISKPGECPQPVETSQPVDKRNGYADMKWSYRYWKETYSTKPKTGKKEEHTIYNPDRYIQGRDEPTCPIPGFGNHLLYDSNVDPGEVGDLISIDTRQDFFSAFQCVNIGGIQNRLTMINNFQGALAACLIDIRTTGTSDAAACKEIFTRYVCSTIWEAISLLSNSCSQFNLVKPIEGEDDFFGIIKDGTRSIYQTLDDTTNELAQEYGNVELNNLIGVGAGEVARKVCLGAFGYDWDLNLESLIDAAYAQTFASVVQATTASREFLTVDPNTERSQHEYRASWVINPGCNIENYRIDLACVTREELAEHSDIRCDALSGFSQSGTSSGNNCDCLDTNLDKEKTKRFFSSRGKLKQNVLIQEKESKIITDDYRYDHLKFTIRPDRKLRKDVKDTCFPQGKEGGVFYFPLVDKTARDILACQLNLKSGSWDCSANIGFFNKLGVSNINDIRINGEDPEDRRVEVLIGDPLDLEVKVRKSAGAPLKCLKVKIDKRRGRGDERRVIEIDRNGPSTYSRRIQQHSYLLFGSLLTRFLLSKPFFSG